MPETFLLLFKYKHPEHYVTSHTFSKKRLKSCSKVAVFTTQLFEYSFENKWKIFRGLQPRTSNHYIYFSSKYDGEEFKYYIYETSVSFLQCVILFWNRISKSKTIAD